MPRQRKLPSGMVKRGATYYASFRGSGRLIRKRLSTDFATACELLNDLRARADRQDFGMVDNDYSWPAIKAEFLKARKQTTRNPGDLKTNLEKFEAYCPIKSVRQITHEYVVGFREWRMVGDDAVSAATVNKQVGAMQSLLNYAVKCKRIGSNPIAGLKRLPHEPGKQRRSLSVEEVTQLFEASPERLKPVWRMFMCTGVRLSELVTLLFSDIDFERRVLTIRAEHAKSGKAREIPLDDDMFATIKQLQSEARDRQPVQGWTPKLTEQQKARFSRDHVFVTNANTPWRNNLLTRFYAICLKAGIEGAERGGSVDIHSLRVSFTTLAIEHGASPKAVQSILGHSTLALTMDVYTRATDSSKRDAIGALPFASASRPKHLIPVQNVRTARASSNQSTQGDSCKLLA